MSNQTTSVDILSHFYHFHADVPFGITKYFALDFQIWSLMREFLADLARRKNK